MKLEKFKQSEDYQEENLKKIKIKGNKISIGEGQSAYQDIFNVYLLGPNNADRDIGVFKHLSNDQKYEVASEGYLSCAEVAGEFDVNKKFIIHSLDIKNLE